MYLQNRLCFELAKMMTKFYDLLCTTQKFIAFMSLTNVCVIWCFTLLFKKDKKQYSFLGGTLFLFILLRKVHRRRGYTYCKNIYAPYEPEKLSRLENSFLNIYHEMVSQWSKVFELDLLKNFDSVDEKRVSTNGIF